MAHLARFSKPLTSLTGNILNTWSGSSSDMRSSSSGLALATDTGPSFLRWWPLRNRLTPPGWVVAVAEVPTEPAPLKLALDASNRRNRGELSETVDEAVVRLGRDAIDVGVKLRDEAIDCEVLGGGWLARRRGDDTDGATEDNVE